MLSRLVKSLKSYLNKMLTINKNFKKDIKILQEYNQLHHRLMDQRIQDIALEMGLTSDQDNEILWDHIYNETTFNVNYK